MPYSNPWGPAVVFDHLEPRLLMHSAGSSGAPDFPPGVIETSAALSLSRDYLAATSVGRKALFGGGGYSDRVDIYDQKTGHWSISHLSQPRDFPAAVTVGNKALFIGGGKYFSEIESNVVDIYDDISGRWSTATLSKNRKYPEATAVGSKVFNVNSNSQPDSSVDVYDDSTGNWSVQQLSVARDSIASATAGGVAVFAGGRDSAFNPTNVVDVYHNDTGLWTTSSLPVAAIFTDGIGIGDKILFGGTFLSNDTTASDLVEIYDTVSDHWSIAHLSVARRDLSVTKLASLVLFGGGSYPPYAFPRPSNVVDVYDSLSGKWGTAELSTASGPVVATSVGNQAFLAGKNSQGGSAVDIFTASPDLHGAINHDSSRSLEVTLENKGVVPLAANQTIQLYATASGDQKVKIALGSVNFSPSLQAESSVTLSVPVSLPSRTLPPGHYDLIAAAMPPGRGHAVLFASMLDAFSVRRVAPAAVKEIQPSATPLISPGVFSMQPIHPPAAVGLHTGQHDLFA